MTSELTSEPFDFSGEPLRFLYTNWRGETGWRRVWPGRIWYGTTEWHKEPQRFLCALDIDKGEARDFALKNVKKFE